MTERILLGTIVLLLAALVALVSWMLRLKLQSQARVQRNENILRGYMSGRRLTDRPPEADFVTGGDAP
jgi:lipopolysaccharide export system protein LptC